MLLTGSKASRLTEPQEVVAEVSNYAVPARSTYYPDVEHLTDRNEIHSRIEALADKCSREVLICVPDGAQREGTMHVAYRLGQAIMARGALMRTMCVRAVYHDRAALYYASRLALLGAQVRTVSAIAIRVMVYDRDVALLPADPCDESAGVLVTRGAGFVSAVCELFEQGWQNAVPFDAGGCPSDAAVLTWQQHAVLRLLAEGHTDETIARRIGVSVRTVRYVIADLTTRLGARSRFQSGVRAAQYGWLARQPRPRSAD